MDRSSECIVCEFRGAESGDVMEEIFKNIVDILINKSSYFSTILLGIVVREAVKIYTVLRKENTELRIKIDRLERGLEDVSILDRSSEEIPNKQVR